MAKKPRLTTRELAVFAMLGTIMYLSKLLMQWAPNIHFLGMFIMTYTLVYRVKALVPIYVYVMLDGLLSGFSLWWAPYLYIWAVLWGVTMLLPTNMPPWLKVPVYMLVSALHGLLFGVMYAPAQALFFGLSFKGMIAWIIAGLPFDVLHMLGNLASGVLIVPLTRLLTKVEKLSFGQE